MDENESVCFSFQWFETIRSLVYVHTIMGPRYVIYCIFEEDKELEPTLDSKCCMKTYFRIDNLMLSRSQFILEFNSQKKYTFALK